MSEAVERTVAYEFDREAVWARVKDRKAVFLDMMVWIEMADGKAKGRTVREKLREGVSAGKLFCPVAPSVLWELYKQDFSMMRTAALIEDLSLNVCYSRYPDVFAWEIERFARRLAGREDDRCSRKMLYTSISGYVAPACQLAYPPGTAEEYVKGSAKLLLDHLDSMGLTALLQLQATGAAADFFKTMPPPPYQNEAKFFRQHLKGDRSKVWAVEAQAVSKAYVEPVIKKLPAPLVPALARFIREAPVGRFESKLPALLVECPALHNHVEAMTRNSEDHNRKDRANDFFDLEMLPVPLAYADVFVTEDKWIRERFLKPGDFLKRSTCRFCATYAELEAWLDAN